MSTHIIKSPNCGASFNRSLNNVNRYTQMRAHKLRIGHVGIGDLGAKRQLIFTKSPCKITVNRQNNKSSVKVNINDANTKTHKYIPSIPLQHTPVHFKENVLIRNSLKLKPINFSKFCHSPYNQLLRHSNVTITKKKVKDVNTPNRSLLLNYGIDVDDSWKILGKGTFGTVVQSVYKGKMVAVKIISCSRRVSRHALLREENVVGLSHPNIVSVIKVVQPEYSHGEMYGLVVMNLSEESTNLHNILHNPQITISQDIQIGYLLDIINGLQYIHSNGILHLDIKAKNILVDKNGKCKLCDFGTTVKTVSLLKKYDRPDYQQGTIAYIAPEILKGETPLYASDVYSFGILMWHIYSREEPYSKHDTEQQLCADNILYHVVKENLRPVVTQPTYVSTPQSVFNKFYQELYEGCWHENPFLRPSTANVRKQLMHFINI